MPRPTILKFKVRFEGMPVRDEGKSSERASRMRADAATEESRSGFCRLLIRRCLLAGGHERFPHVEKLQGHVPQPSQKSALRTSKLDIHNTLLSPSSPCMVPRDATSQMCPLIEHILLPADYQPQSVRQTCILLKGKVSLPLPQPLLGSGLQ